MIKLIVCVTKAEHLSTTEFRDYWHNTHRQLTLEFTRQTGAISFQQSSTLHIDLNERLQSLTHSSHQLFDGVGEVVWENALTPKQLFEDPDFIEHLKQVIASWSQFTDPSKSRIFFTDTEELLQL